MDRIQYREMIKRERERIQRSIKGGEASSPLAGWSNRDKMEKSFSKPLYADTYSLASPPTTIRIMPLGFAEIGVSFGLFEGD